MLKRKNLTQLQLTAIDFAKAKKKCGLFLDMGKGKTASSLTIASDFIDDFFVNKILIIGPLRVANNVWQQEARNWEHLKHLHIGICTGSEQDRLAVLKANHDITVINRENVEWLIENCKWRWDMLIIDESSSFKSSKAKRFKALKKITKYLKSIILLSGTPSPNGEQDLWSQIFLLDSGQRLGRTMTAFRQRFFTSDYMGYTYKINPGASQIIKDLIKDICITLEDVNEKEDTSISSTEYIELPEKTKKQYKELEKQFMLSLENVDITTMSAAALGNKLLQLCNGAVYDIDKNYHVLHDEKIKKLKDIIEENPNENFLIAYNFKSDLDRLVKAFPDAVVMGKHDHEINLWNAGKIKILLAHPASAGHGLNLQFGGNIIIWFGLTWSLELYQQFNKRLDRPGQKKQVKIIHLVTKNCIDERVLQAINSKATTQQQLIDYLRLCIKTEHH